MHNETRSARNSAVRPSNPEVFGTLLDAFGKHRQAGMKLLLKRGLDVHYRCLRHMVSRVTMWLR